MTDLTTEDFWKSYWSTLKLPIVVDQSFKNDRVIAKTISSVQKKDIKNALEIGCAPGKWLSFIAQNFNCPVTGIEYLDIAAAKTVENLKLQQIKDFNVIHTDFFKHNLTDKYDMVLSLGFIEHFSNYEKVLEDQLRLVSPKGYLIIGIPRFVGINYIVQKGIDIFITNKLIESHNLKTMNLKIFDDFAHKNGLNIITNNFIGGFEPGLFPVNDIPNVFVRVFFKVLIRLCNLIFKNLNTSFSASYQIAIFKK